VHRDLDVRVEGGLVDDLATVRIFHERELLCRDHLETYPGFWDMGEQRR
jgi:hypothetical protein